MQQAWTQVQLDPSEAHLLQLGSGAGALAWAVGSTYLEKGKLPPAYKIDGELWPRVGHQMISVRQGDVVHKTLHGEILDIDSAGQLKRKIILPKEEAERNAAAYFHFQNQLGEKSAPAVFLPLRNLNGLTMEQDYARGKHYSLLSSAEKEIFMRDLKALTQRSWNELSFWPGAHRLPIPSAVAPPTFQIGDVVITPDFKPDNFRYYNNQLVSFDNALVRLTSSMARSWQAP